MSRLMKVVLKNMRTYILVVIAIFSTQSNSQCFQGFTTGAQHSLVIKSDGSLWSFGQNNSGELGLNTTASPIYSPVMVSNEPIWSKVFAVSDRSFVIKTDGTLWACGNGAGGSLGTGNQDDVYALTQIGTDSDWDEVYSGAATIARKNDGTMWGWGANVFGQLNLGIMNLQFTPVQISAETDWDKINMAMHTLALKTDGTLWACGLNDFGQLGDGTNTNSLNFIQVGTDADWVDIASGFLYKQSLAIKSDGTLWGWGDNSNDVLGYGLPSEVTIPTQLGTDTDWAKVSAGYYVTIALKTDGTLWRSSATGFQQLEADNDWVDIYNGYAHFFATKADGTLWGLGGNDYGQLGLGSGVQGTSVMTQLSCSTFLGENEQEFNNRLVIFPNPTTDFIYIENNSMSAIDKVTLTDITGKMIFESNGELSNMDLQHLDRGIYILNISTVRSEFHYKILKK